MKQLFYAALAALVIAGPVGCKTTLNDGTLRACRNDFITLRKELKAGHLVSARWKDKKKNEVAAKDWIDVADAAIKNIDTALGIKTAPEAAVAPVTSEGK